MIPIRDDQPRFSTPFVNYFIVALNALAFFYELSIQTQGHRALDRFVYQFGVVPTHVELALAHLNLAGVFLPILTSMFLHGSWLHIIGNMWVLWIFGDNIEDHLGHFSYLLFYLISGFVAAFTHILLNLGSNIPSVGASGAIAGIMGAYFVLYPRARVLTLVPLFFVFFIWLPAWVWLGIWFIGQSLVGAATAIAVTANTSGGVAVWAHVGGFVAGVLLIRLFPARPRRYHYGM